MRPGQEWDPRSPMNLWHIFLPLLVQDNLLYILSLTSLGSTWPLSCHDLLLKGGLGMGTAGMEMVRKGRRKMCYLCVLSRLEKWYGKWRKQISSHCEITHCEFFIPAGLGSSEEHPLPVSSYHLPSPFRPQWGLELPKSEKISIISPWFWFVFRRKKNGSFQCKYQ